MTNRDLAERRLLLCLRLTVHDRAVLPVPSNDWSESVHAGYQQILSRTRHLDDARHEGLLIGNMRYESILDAGAPPALCRILFTCGNTEIS